MDTMDKRMNNLMMIRRSLLDTFGDNIESALVYGSTLNADFCETSDYDILVVFRKLSVSDLNAIRMIKEEYERLGIVIDFNSHLVSDLPSERGGLYWHNNRSVFIQKELALTGLPIIGNNPFEGYEVNMEEMQIETVRMLNSFSYQARKTIVNKDLTHCDENKIFMIKWCIYGSLYLLAAKGYFFKSRREGLEMFSKVFDTKIDPMVFLDMKVNRPHSISHEDIEMAYEYLNYLDKTAWRLYSNAQCMISVIAS